MCALALLRIASAALWPSVCGAALLSFVNPLNVGNGCLGVRMCARTYSYVCYVPDDNDVWHRHGLQPQRQAGDVTRARANRVRRPTQTYPHIRRAVRCHARHKRTRTISTFLRPNDAAPLAMCLRAPQRCWLLYMYVVCE